MANQDCSSNKKIKILRIVSNLGIGGIQRQLLLQTEYLRKHHPEVSIDICAFYRGGKLKEEFEKQTKVYILDASHKYSIRALFKLIILASNYNVLHIHKMEDIIPVCCLAAIISKKEIILHFHFTYSWPNKKKWLIERLCCSQAKKIIAVSLTVSSHLFQKLFPYPPKLKCVYNGIKIRKIKKEKSLIFRIGVISRLEKFKRIDKFIESISSILKKRKDIETFIAGTGKMEKELKKLSADSKIKFLGQVEAEKVLKKINIGILPSKKEGFSNTILEYMASHTLAIVSDIPQNKEAIPDYNTGYPVIIDELSKAILKAINYPVISKKKVINAQKRVVKFSIEKTVKNIYKEWIS